MSGLNISPHSHGKHVGDSNAAAPHIEPTSSTSWPTSSRNLFDDSDQLEVSGHARVWWDHSATAYVILRTSGQLLECNSRARQLLGIPETHDRGISLFDLIDPACLPDLKNFLLQTARPPAIPRLAVRKIDEHKSASGELTLELIVAKHSSVALALTDSGELEKARLEIKSLREQLNRVQRLELLSELSVGLTHDFNNILQVVETYAIILGRKKSLDNQADTCIREIQDAARRGSQLTRESSLWASEPVGIQNALRSTGSSSVH